VTSLSKFVLLESTLRCTRQWRLWLTKLCYSVFCIKGKSS